jgi:hypothetical protein
MARVRQSGNLTQSSLSIIKVCGTNPEINIHARHSSKSWTLPVMSSSRLLIAWFLVAMLAVSGLVPAAGMPSEHAVHTHAVTAEDAHGAPSLLLEECIPLIHCQAGSWLDTSFRTATNVVPGLPHYLPILDATASPDWIPDPVHPPPRLS